MSSVSNIASKETTCTKEVNLKKKATLILIPNENISAYTSPHKHTNTDTFSLSLKLTDYQN
jgi:hypothetical protein